MYLRECVRACVFVFTYNMNCVYLCVLVNLCMCLLVASALSVSHLSCLNRRLQNNKEKHYCGKREWAEWWESNKVQQTNPVRVSEQFYHLKELWKKILTKKMGRSLLMSKRQKKETNEHWSHTITLETLHTSLSPSSSLSLLLLFLISFKMCEVMQRGNNRL